MASGPLVCVWHWADSHTPGPASTQGYFVTLTLCRGHRLQPGREWAAIGCHSLKKFLKPHSRSSRFHLKSRFPVLKDPKGSQRWVDPPRSDNLRVQHLHGTRAPESALTLALFLLQLGGHTSIAVATFPASLGQCEPPSCSGLIWVPSSPAPKAREFTVSDLRTKRCPGGSVARTKWGWGHAWGVQSHWKERCAVRVEGSCRTGRSWAQG